MLGNKSTTLSASDASGIKVLVVDDYPNAADMMAQWLARLGYQARTARDGRTALDIAQVFRPEIVLLDLAMPNVSGYDLARQIRQQPWGKETFVVAVTGFGSQEERQRNQDAGVDVYLLKPVSHDNIKALLNEYSSSKRA